MESKMKLTLGWNWNMAMAAALVTLWGAGTPAEAQPVRVLGLDVSAWQGSLSTTTWATLKRPTAQGGDGRDFVLIRSSRGGTTGEDHRQGGYASGNNTFYNFSQRYDDPYFVQNINRATAAGMFAGSYHFDRADVLASTLNSDGVTTAGVANSGIDEADHMLQMAGPWMRPGYLLPVLDLEAGASQYTAAGLSSWAVAFSDRIYQQMGIRPIVYVNSSYANSEVNSTVATTMPVLWIARPSTGDPLTTEPPPALPTYPNVYGVWNPLYPTIPDPQPWEFWQYNTGAGLIGYTGNIDKDVANGGMEYLKDFLVPALWMNDISGQWTTLLSWNSGQTPVAPVPGAGQLTPVGTQTLPTPRLPDTNDTVVLDRASAAITVTLASGTQNIRKLYMRETLNITGGSLTINYVPSVDSSSIAAQFSGPVTLSGSASLSVHTLQVDATRTFLLSGGTLTFNTLNLMPHSSTPAKLLLNGDMNFNSLPAASTATIANGSGAGSSGWIDLGGASRAFTVATGAGMFVNVPISNGGLTKTGLGTLHLGTNNTFNGLTVVSAGTLALDSGGSLSNSSHIIVSNTATFSVAAQPAAFTLGVGQTLAGSGSVVGRVTAYGTVSPGASVGKLTFSTNLTLAGTTIMEVSRNGSVVTNDTLTCAATLSYGGTLVVTNSGPDPLAHGDTFRLFSAATHASFFSATNLPSLGASFRWDTSGLGTGVLQVVSVLPPLFQSSVQSGPDLILAGTNGIAGASYYLLSSTNPCLAMTNWTRVLTNLYGPGGSFSNSIPVDPLENARFYRVQSAN